MNRYLIALRDAVRYDLGSPNNGSNPLVDKDSQRKAVFDVYYECKRMEFKDPAGAIIVFVSTFYGLWVSRPSLSLSSTVRSHVRVANRAEILGGLRRILFRPLQQETAGG